MDGRIERAVAYIHLHFNRRIMLAELSREVGVSTPHLVFLFKKELGVTFKGYVKRLRIQRSQELMRNVYLSITEVSGHVGYDHLTNFERDFKKLTHSTPRDYRRQLQNIG